MANNTAQHFVPQFYLREWSDCPEKLWQYSMTGKKPTLIRIKNVAFERGLYTHPAADNLPPLKTEMDLSKMEGIYSSVWPDIIDRANNLRTRRNLATFVSLMVLRNPKHRRDVERRNARLREMVKGLSPEQIVEIHVGGVKVQTSVRQVLSEAREDTQQVNTDFLRSMRYCVNDLAEVIVRRRWGVVFAERPEFITSDCPVVLDRGTCAKIVFGFRTPGTRILFPFCPSRLLLIDDSWPEDFGHYRLKDCDVYNRILARGSNRFVYANNDFPNLPAKIAKWRNEPDE